MVQLIYCADGNKRFAEIAIKHGFTYGAQLPNTVYFKPEFVDQNWKNPDREKYMAALAKHTPATATVLDLEREDQYAEVISWMWEAARHVGKSLIIIPKVMSIIPRIPDTIAGKQVVLGYSIPTKFGGTCVPVWEFGRRPVHLLGGSPKEQLMHASYLNVASADGNYSTKIALQFAKFWNGHEWVNVADARQHPRDAEDAPYLAFELSCINIKAAWLGCTAMIRFAVESDLPAIKKIANQYKDELGFVMLPALRKAIKKRELYVAEYGGYIVGFCNWHRRRDGWSTIYEIAVRRDYVGQKIGRALLEAVPAPRRLKTTVDNEIANCFYSKAGMLLEAVEQGKKRPLNVWTTTF